MELRTRRNGDKEVGLDESWQQGGAVQTFSDPGHGDGGVLEEPENLVRAVREFEVSIGTQMLDAM